MAVPSWEVGAWYCAPVLTNQEVFWPGGVAVAYVIVADDAAAADVPRDKLWPKQLWPM